MNVLGICLISIALHVTGVTLTLYVLYSCVIGKNNAQQQRANFSNSPSAQNVQRVQVSY